MDMDPPAELRATAQERWPALPLEPWRDTRDTLHRWTQVVGKVKLALAPHVNHWWEVPFTVTARGLTTGAMPTPDGRVLQVDFDLVDHLLEAQTSDGDARTLPLEPGTVADFHDAVMDALDALGVDVEIWTTPVEVEDRTPFEEDARHRAYDPGWANRFWRALLQADRVLNRFRCDFIGKASPVQFFWGGFDLATTRFSGRAVPPHAPVPHVSDRIVQEAYSHEVMSAGWWTGGPGMEEAAFFAYAHPEPEGFADRRLLPDAARYHEGLHEFVLPHEAVRNAPSPDDAVLAFLEGAYEAAADLGDWDREALDAPGGWAVTRQLPGDR